MRASRVTVAAAVLAAGVLVGSAAAAEPYEDGSDPNAPTWYRSTPRSGPTTGAPTDRVEDIAQIGGTVYVAGTFRSIRPTGQGATPQAYLAAFDAGTGQVLASFNPVFDGPVHTLAVADGNRLYAGGAFFHVDGRARSRLVALTPAGEVVTSWRADVSGGDVRSVVATSSYLYVGGGFRQVRATRRNNVARLRRSDGSVDNAWRASVNGTVLTVELPPARDRVYLGGRFSSVGGAGGTAYLASVRTEDGAVRSFAARPGREVFDVLADGSGRVWVAEGGPGGQAEVYDAAGRRLARWPTEGDTETVERIGGRIYFGGHEQGPGAVPAATVDPATLRWDTTSWPAPKRVGDGIWAFHATRGRLWTGGWFQVPRQGLAIFDAR